MFCVARPFSIVTRFAYFSATSTPSRPARGSVQGKHPIVSNWLDVLDFHPKGFPRLAERVPELLPPLPAPIDGVGIGEELRGLELVVGSDVVQLPLEIAAVPRLVSQSHQLDVLLRHRPPSISLWP